MVKGPSYDKNGMKKGAWSPEEDTKLKAHVEKYGHWNWREVPKYAGLSRCGKSCRLRWMNYLRPNVRHGNFTKQEENIILTLHADVGNKWSMIAAKLPGRTDNEIKNYWHTHLKKQAKETRETLKKNNCEAKRQSRESFKYKQSNKRVKVENVPIDAKSHAILESSPLSLKEHSGDMLLTDGSDLVHVSGTKLLGNDLWVQEMCDYGTGDFWSEPYVVDNFFVQNNIPSDLSYVYDTSEDVFYQVIQELRRRLS